MGIDIDESSACNICSGDTDSDTNRRERGIASVRIDGNAKDGRGWYWLVRLGRWGGRRDLDWDGSVGVMISGRGTAIMRGRKDTIEFDKIRTPLQV